MDQPFAVPVPPDDQPACVLGAWIYRDALPHELVWLARLAPVQAAALSWERWRADPDPPDGQLAWDRAAERAYRYVFNPRTYRA